MNKKSLVILGLVAIFGLGLVSCKKECKCIGKLNGQTVVNTSATTKKSDCQASYSESFGGYTVTVNCTWGN